MKKEIRTETILRYLEGMCTNVERRRVEKWMAADPLHAQEMESLRRIWSSPKDEEVKVNLESAWAATANKIGLVPKTVASASPVGKNLFLHSAYGERSTFSIAVRVAAVVLLLLGISYEATRFLNKPPKERHQFVTQEIAAERGQRVRLLLGDSSTVVLNSASVLRLPDEFSGSSREVFLQGEAYFDVAHVESVPFIVRTNDAVIQVVGTRFDVRAWPDENKAEVVVARGTVRVRSNWTPDSADVVVRGGQGSTIRHGQSPTKVRDVDLERVLAWTTGRLVFQRTPLADALRELERRYDIQFDVKDTNLLKKTLTASLRNESLTEVLNLVALSLDMRCEKKGNVVILSGPGRK